MPEKNFKIPAADIKDIIPGKGGCIATDFITVDGLPVAFMYREQPENDVDSGWRFVTGRESEEYMMDPANHGAYDLNMIANCDPDIVPFMDFPIGAAFEREGGTGRFLPVEFDPPTE